MIVTVTGCTAITSKHVLLKEKLNNINKSDGISEEEVIIIAQNYMIEKGLDGSYSIEHPKIQEAPTFTYPAWEIIFKAKYKESVKKAGVFGVFGMFRWWISLDVDKQTGEVTSVGCPDL